MGKCVNKCEELQLIDMAYGLLQYCDAVGWVFWPVKPTTESENQLQLDYLSTSMSTLIVWQRSTIRQLWAASNDSRPWVVPQLINACPLPRGRDGSLRIQSLVEFLISSGHLSPHIGSAWRAHHNNNNNNDCCFRCHGTVTCGPQPPGSSPGIFVQASTCQ